MICGDEGGEKGGAPRRALWSRRGGGVGDGLCFYFETRRTHRDTGTVRDDGQGGRTRTRKMVAVCFSLRLGLSFSDRRWVSHNWEICTNF